MDQNLLDTLVHFDFQEQSNQEQNNHYDYHIAEMLNHLLRQSNYKKLLVELSQHMNHYQTYCLRTHLYLNYSLRNNL